MRIYKIKAPRTQILYNSVKILKEQGLIKRDKRDLIKQMKERELTQIINPAKVPWYCHAGTHYSEPLVVNSLLNH